MKPGRNEILESLLRELKEEGHWVSSGSFTLDTKLAETKLRNFQLPLPNGYAAKVVQFAVANSARRIEVNETAARFTMSFDGDTLPAHQVEGLLNYLLRDHLPDTQSHLRHLASALRGAVALNPRSVTFESHSGYSGFRREWDRAGWRTTELPKGMPAGNRFVVYRTLGQRLASLVGFEGGKRLSEMEVLANLCGFCPAELVLQNKVLEHKLFSPERGNPTRNCALPSPVSPSSTQYLVAGTFHRDEHILQDVLPAKKGERTSLGALPGLDGSPRCRAWIGIAANLTRGSQVLYVDDGVALNKSHLSLPCPGLRVVYSCELLDKDISGFQLVKNRKHREHLRELEAVAERMKAHLEQQVESFSPPMQRRVTGALKRLQRDSLPEVY